MKLQPGLYIASKHNLIAEQKSWTEDDVCKNFDFGSCEHWLLIDNGAHPQPINYVDDILPYLAIFDDLDGDQITDITNALAHLIDFEKLMIELTRD